MKYIIMSAGLGTRWGNFLNISKQELTVNGENLLQRIVRQIREIVPNPEIIIVSNNQNHFVDGTRLHRPLYSDYYKSKYAFELIDGDIIYFYGDTYYEEDTINIIINSQLDDVMFFGNSKSIVALKVKKFNEFKKVIEEYSGTESIYKYYKHLQIHDNISRFSSVGNGFMNINCPEDYEKLLMLKQECILTQQISKKRKVKKIEENEINENSNT